MKFTPAKDYDGLLIQASALATLVRCMEQTRCLSSANYAIAKLKGQVESEREMNSILTKENETLKARIAALAATGGQA